MDSQTIIVWMIIASIGLMLMIGFSRQLKWLLLFSIRGAVGFVGFIVCNAITSVFGLTVGLNAVNAGFVGLLGIPGFVTLYIINFII